MTDELRATEPDLDETAIIARDLIRFDTTNYGEGRSNGEAEAAAYVEAKLSELGLRPQVFESDPGRASVVARVEGADPGKPALVVHGHLDVVPADPRNWSVDPFGGEIKDGLLWGRGAVDMKNMDAMILTAVGDILRAGQRPARDLVVAFFADEEDGGRRGSHHLVDTHPELFAGATEAISEVGGYSIDLAGRRAYLLQTGEKSLVWIKLIARGRAAHGSRLIRENAITRLAEAVVALGREDWPIQLTATTTRLIGELGRLLDVDPQRIGPDEVVIRTGTAAGFILATLRTTTNPTLLEAGYKHNVIPDTAEALIDIRTLPGEEDAVLARVRELIGDDVEIEVMHRDIGLEAEFGGGLVEAITDTLQQHDPGAPVLPYLLSGGTDNKALSKLGITGYGFAPLRLPADLDFPGMFHGVDERVPLDALVFGRTVLRDLLRAY
ncbi:Acetylornithine deacetylase/Succinyl-diaminopimelate desuccinylase [Leifsonia sp. 98AMF]|uniref:M20/M25/M40 family metallo-hydrolase n=1 Tax=unclassified Leifsonia TaxID=2663824 RepID=UPI00087BC88F|nr:MULTISPECIES: M20/M25/M40 family metallo-hydrolase [unclassified Leifsonia]SDH36557.1 Acetylornithine deacetylase/Succinyl-diaminopimelate desuccinylase [Leifsonia sp. 197AMF]SDI99227.1 Acetylornithine deacetylase/Succinyl-diaminopimelate desuccinylase [Leifsonia sp. 466MF]SDJ75471.1 Acetylornithine deacetylase/Succinyl-diaminopimelate desuccinylase [Leifsonia sp. 157MF]SDO02466.1 Acetylornithine deacetylase/Succinyl-diaminopimelate desuccinylase [Leifsonia sp. 509MF]SEN01399.1 Acetylornith